MTKSERHRKKKLSVLPSLSPSRRSKCCKSAKQNTPKLHTELLRDDALFTILVQKKIGKEEEGEGRRFRRARPSRRRFMRMSEEEEEGKGKKLQFHSVRAAREGWWKEAKRNSRGDIKKCSVDLPPPLLCLCHSLLPVFMKN